MSEFDEELATLVTRIRARHMTVDLCDLVLARPEDLRRSPALFIKEFIKKYPQADIADVKQSLGQIRILFDSQGVEGVELFKADLCGEKN